MQQKGMTIWLTGLPASGKTTIAKALVAELEQQGRRVELIDGDAFRKLAGWKLGFSRDDRNANVRAIGGLAAMMTWDGAICIVACISPYRDIRHEVRELIGADLFRLVYVKCPLKECERRDPKGLYAKARAGKITGMTGLDDPYEEPEHPDLCVETGEQSLGVCVEKIKGYLRL